MNTLRRITCRLIAVQLPVFYAGNVIAVQRIKPLMNGLKYEELKEKMLRKFDIIRRIETTKYIPHDIMSERGVYIWELEDIHLQL